jgi:D-glycero-alpha-D-manno-heptose-7-phosphate kinase
MLIVRSPVRISFGGGGTDLPPYYEKYGGAVLSTTINKYFYTVLTKRNDEKIQVISSDLRIIETWRDIERMEVRESDLEIPLAVMKEVSLSVPVNLFLASEIPPGTGLGSSASVCVNILKVLTAYLQIPYTNQELAEKAFHIARNVLGKPVGKQDEYAASFGGLNLISFHPSGKTSVVPLDLSPELMLEFQASLMLFFTGSAHNSWEILRQQEESTKKQTGETLKSLHEISRLAIRMQNALIRGDLADFGRLLDESWQAKKNISEKISNSRIDRLYQLARENGALGGKISGAGSGGFLLLYCQPQKQPAVREAFACEGVRELHFEFDFQGARVLVNDPFLDNDSRCGMRWSFAPT